MITGYRIHASVKHTLIINVLLNFYKLKLFKVFPLFSWIQFKENQFSSMNDVGKQYNK